MKRKYLVYFPKPRKSRKRLAISDGWFQTYPLKFMFSKKATKFDKIFTVKLTVKVLSIFVAFLENMNFNDTSRHNTVKMTSGFFRLEFYFQLKSDWIQFKQGMQKNPSNPIDLQNPRSDGQIGDVAVAFHEVSFLRKKNIYVFLIVSHWL